MFEFLGKIVDKLQDPLVILLFLVSVGLSVLVYIEKKDNKTLNGCIRDGLGENNVAIARLVTLVEILIYGRGRNGSA
jgi:hypothetical protein